MADQDPQFLVCVTTIPIINSAWIQFSDLYNKTKDHNPVFSRTFSVAETGLKKILESAQPLVEKYNGPIKYLNTVACNKLNNLKEAYPVITKPTDQVIDSGREMCNAIVKPAFQGITAVKQLGANTYKTGTEAITTAQHNLDELKTRFGKSAGAAQSKLWNAWQELSKEEKSETDQEGNKSLVLERLAVNVGRHIVTRVGNSISYVETTIVEMPGTLQENYKKMQGYTEDLWIALKNAEYRDRMTNLVMVYPINTLRYMQETVSFLLEQAHKLQAPDKVAEEKDNKQD